MNIEQALEKALLILMHSHTKLAQEEYDRNPAYNNTHYSHIAEDKIIKILQDQSPNTLTKFFNGLGS